MVEDVAVVIPFYRANNTISKVLDALEDQSADHVTVVIVDDSPGDRFNHSPENWELQIQYLKNDTNEGLATSLTRGIKSVDADIVVTLHADCVPQDRDWLTHLIDPLQQRSDVGAVTSRVLIDFDTLSPINKAFSYVYDMGAVCSEYSEVLERVDHVENKADAYRREILADIGYFNPSYKTSNEDTELSEEIKARDFKLLRQNKAPVKHILNDNERQGSVQSHLRKGYEYTRQTIHPWRRYGVNYKLDALFAVILLFAVLPVPAILISAASIGFHRRFFAFSFPLILAGTVLSIPAVGTVVGSLYLLTKGAVHAVHYVQDFKKVDLVIPIILFTIIWECAAAIGWMQGISHTATYHVHRFLGDQRSE